MYGGDTIFAADLIVEMAKEKKISTCLDIGCGFGFFGIELMKALLFSDMLCDEEIGYKNLANSDYWSIQLEGIEINTNIRNPVWDYFYKHVWTERIEGFFTTKPQYAKYDVIVGLDILEHFTEDIALEVVSKIEKNARDLIVFSTPTFFYKDKYADSIYEEHKCLFPVDYFYKNGYITSISEDGVTLRAFKSF